MATLGANILDRSSSCRQPLRNSSSVRVPSLFSSILKQSRGSIFAKARPYWLQMLKDERAGNVWMFDNWLQNTINVSNNYNHFGSFNVRLTRTQYDWRFIDSSNESKFVWLIVQRNVNDGILIKKNQALQPNGQVCNLIAKICQTNISFYEHVQLRPLIRIALQH